MKKMLSVLAMLIAMQTLLAQKPCSSAAHRQFDFWIGDWEAFGKNGQKAGDSKISPILGSCIILEEWTSASLQQGFRFAGKSFNTYNASTKQWQQTWVDNAGGSNEYLQGEGGEGKIVFRTTPFPFNKDTMAIRRLSFYKLDENKVRQHGEISKDNGKKWVTEYDLEYRRKQLNPAAEADSLLKNMEAAYNKGDYKKIADRYSKNGKIVKKKVEASGREQLQNYWAGFTSLAGTWKLINEKTEKIGEQIWVKGVSEITDKNKKLHKVNFTLLLIQEDDTWKILQDAYW